jgi:hypothetical protein
MSLELVNSLATFGTFVVIAATAIAALVQLRHARGSNQIAALNEIRETMETPDFQAARHFVMFDLSAKLQDPAFRYQVDHPSARTDETRRLMAMIARLANFYENIGVLVKTGFVEKDLVVEIQSGMLIGAWERVAPVVAIYRRTEGSGIWENFEYLAVLVQDWLAAHPKGDYPPGVRRIELKDEWLEADKQYASSLAPA